MTRFPFFQVLQWKKVGEPYDHIYDVTFKARDTQKTSHIDERRSDRDKKKRTRRRRAFSLDK